MKSPAFACVLLAFLIAGCNEIAEDVPPLDQVIETECSVDQDCYATGCSGEVCTGEPVATTCEYLEEYGCLTFASCGCVDGSCMWKTGREYDSCMENIGKNI